LSLDTGGNLRMLNVFVYLRQRRSADLLDGDAECLVTSPNEPGRFRILRKPRTQGMNIDLWAIEELYPRLRRRFPLTTNLEDQCLSWVRMKGSFQLIPNSDIITGGTCVGVPGNISFSMIPAALHEAWTQYRPGPSFIRCMDRPRSGLSSALYRIGRAEPRFPVPTTQTQSISIQVTCVIYVRPVSITDVHVRGWESISIRINSRPGEQGSLSSLTTGIHHNRPKPVCAEWFYAGAAAFDLSPASSYFLILNPEYVGMSHSP